MQDIYSLYSYYALNYVFNGYSVFFFALGAFLGSFYNVLIFRLPEKAVFAKKRSHCRHCNKMIPFYLNVPILSWLFLRGKTACCKKPLSIQYPLVELATAILFVMIYWHSPFIEYTNGHYSIEWRALIRFIHQIMFASLLLIGSVIDLRLKILPNEITLGMVGLSVIWIVIHPELQWHASLLGILFGGGIPYLVAWTYWIIRKKQGLGMGDVKLLAGIGGWLGYQAILPTIFTASILGSFIGTAVLIIQKRSHLQYELPFGPFLSIGAMIYVFTGQHIITLLANM
ncbi:MAG: prepilin peptidase [Proteobacteria bacterium]|nr:prepilin peptidase [Pseudomonadota bacterium]